MKTALTLVFLLTVSLLAGCGTLYKSVVTITDVRNVVMNELGREYRAGRIDPATDAKITAADQAYREAVTVAVATLQAYKVSKEGDPVAALQAVKSAVTALIDILATYVDARPQYTALAKAKDL